MEHLSDNNSVKSVFGDFRYLTKYCRSSTKQAFEKKYKIGLISVDNVNNFVYNFDFSTLFLSKMWIN